MRTKLVDIISHFGEKNQVAKTVEELTELSLALQHYGHGKISKDEVVSEIADVAVMVSQLIIIFGEDEVDKVVQFKLNRTLELIGKKGI